MNGARSIASILVGPRHRKAMGHIAGLAASIRDVGLLHPIVVRPDGVLIAGARRIAAFKALGRGEIPVTVVDLDSAARGEFAENVCRKDFTPSELVAIGAEVERIEREDAKARMTLGKVSTGSGKARDKIAARLGVSGRTYEKAKTVVEAAEAEPDKFGKLLENMDKTGRVNGVYRRLQNIKAGEAIRAEPPPLPGNGPYRAGLIDIPWAYEPDDEERAKVRGVLPYPTMSIDEACALDVASILADVCAVGLWVTNYVLARGLHLPILAAWSLEPKSVVTWAKARVGRGYWVKGQTEHLVIATRGKPTVTLTDQTTLLKGPFHLVRKGAHSAKPVEVYAYFESLFPAPRYFDLFSRYQHNDRWDCHGDEAPTGDAVAQGAAQ